MGTRRLVLVSYTPLDAGGGVPRFNRELKAGFEKANWTVQHFSWWNVAPELGVHPDAQSIPEWDKAKLLSRWLLRQLSDDDVVIADGFWCDGLEHRRTTIQHCHGNWSHTTADDVAKGIPPEFPQHAATQLAFRKRYLAAGRKLTTVSDFIAHQMKLQWGFDSTVINNGIDLDLFRPSSKKLPRTKPIVIHFVTNANKGFDHIAAVKESVNADVWLLDEAAERLQMPKYEALAQADVALHPSAHEGSSLAVLESLSSGIPLVSYDVGLMWWARRNASGTDCDPGLILDRAKRSPARTALAVKEVLESFDPAVASARARRFASMFSLDRFHREWLSYVQKLF